MGSLSVTCHPTQENTPRNNPSQPGRYSEGWVELGSLIVAWLGIEPMTAWSQALRNQVTQLKGNYHEKS